MNIRCFFFNVHALDNETRIHLLCGYESQINIIIIILDYLNTLEQSNNNNNMMMIKIEPRGSVLIRLAVTSRPDVPCRRRRRRRRRREAAERRARVRGCNGRRGCVCVCGRQRAVYSRRERGDGGELPDRTRAHRVWRRPAKYTFIW